MRKQMVLACVLAATMSLAAHADTYTIDPIHSNVGFSVRHFAITRVTGRFGDFSGTFEYDQADSSKWAATVTIQAASIDTRDSSRDKHLRSEDFLDAVKFPTITFKSTRTVPKGENKFDLVGDLTLHGVTKPVTLTVEMLGAVEGERFGRKVGFTATTKINRMDFGTKFNATLETGGLVVGHDVDISLDVEGTLKK